MIIEDRYIYIDLQAQSADNQTILVEGKGFENLISPVAYFEQVIGQYVLYRLTLMYLELNYPIYLAVPNLAYTGHLQEIIFSYAIEQLNINLIVFDVESEEITQWQS